MNNLFEYIKESKAELSRVSWPTRTQTIKLTIIVIIFTLAVSMVIGGLDYVFTQVLQKLILKG
jgi:preprotein translocase subunit SecE